MFGLLMNLFGCRSVCFFLFSLQYQRNSFVHLVVVDDNKDSSTQVMTNDVDVANNYNKANRKTEGRIQYRNIYYYQRA